MKTGRESQAAGTEMQIIYWYGGGSGKKDERYIELWLPVGEG